MYNFIQQLKFLEFMDVSLNRMVELLDLIWLEHLRPTKEDQLHLDTMVMVSLESMAKLSQIKN